MFQAHGKVQQTEKIKRFYQHNKRHYKIGKKYIVNVVIGMYMNLHKLLGGIKKGTSSREGGIKSYWLTKPFHMSPFKQVY